MAPRHPTIDEINAGKLVVDDLVRVDCLIQGERICGTGRVIEVLKDGFIVSMNRFGRVFCLADGLYPFGEPEIVRIKIWRVVGQQGEVGVYFAEQEASDANAFACGGWGEVKEEIVGAIRAS